MRFANRVIWITGASSGIGAALARTLAAEGAKLILSSRREAELAAVRQTCANADIHEILPLNLSRHGTFPGAVTEVLGRCGRIDVLVNNAGVSQRALALETSMDVERTIMEVDYFGPVALTKAVLPSMRDRCSGQIVVVSSVMGMIGTPGRSTYAAAKHALHGYFDSLRAELWRDNIHVTIVCPGYVRTAVSLNALGPTGERHQRNDLTTDGGITPEKCAAAIASGIARRKDEVYVGGGEIWAIYLQRIVPWLLRRIVRRMKFSVHDRP